MKVTCHLFMALLTMFCGRQLSTAQEYVSTDADKTVAVGIMRSLREKGPAVELPEMMVLSAKSLLGTPYVAGTLDEDPSDEKLRIYLTKTDCILFVETCLDLALAVREADGKEPSFNDFASVVSRSRYRKEPPYSYSDRIHYTTEWIRRLGSSLKDITLDLGGEVYDHPISFMSSHPGSYKQLAGADDLPKAAMELERIAAVEKELNKEPMTYIPKDKIASAAKGIKSGDIICFVTTIEGLDISHVGIAYVEDGRVGFIHASLNDGKVVIDSRTIEEYVRPRRNLSGIKVVRPL